MSLDNIQLPGIVIQDLFKDCLIDLDTAQPVSNSSNSGNIPFLGKNGEQVTILVKDQNALYLSEKELNFLIGIIAACKLTMADVALVNLEKNKGLTYKQITDQLKAEKVFLFDVDPAELDLPVTFPNYQVQRYNRQVYLSAPALALLEDDRMEKSKLWTCLKQIFSL